jgi:hypothetical protein
MITALGILAVIALGLTIASGFGKVPLWIPVLLDSVILVVMTVRG